MLSIPRSTALQEWQNEVGAGRTMAQPRKILIRDRISVDPANKERSMNFIQLCVGPFKCVRQVSK